MTDRQRIRRTRRNNRSHGDTRYTGNKGWVIEQARKRYGKALFAAHNEALLDKLCLYERGILHAESILVIGH